MTKLYIIENEFKKTRYLIHTFEFRGITECIIELINSSYVIFGFYVNSGPECQSKFSCLLLLSVDL